MTQVQASKSLPGPTRLWRYLSLDKLVDLLSTSELFFAPLASFAATDPFEGYLPSVGFEAYASIFRKPINETEALQKQVVEDRLRRGNPLTDAERKALRASLDEVRLKLRQIVPAIAKATTVNCWHAKR